MYLRVGTTGEPFDYRIKRCDALPESDNGVGRWRSKKIRLEIAAAFGRVAEPPRAATDLPFADGIEDARRLVSAFDSFDTVGETVSDTKGEGNVVLMEGHSTDPRPK